MFVASDSHSDLPIFPLLERASRHDMLSLLHTFFSMKSYLPEFKIEKMLLNSAMDAFPVYDYCREQGITPFIDFKKTNNGNFKYKDDFTLDKAGVPICKMGYVCTTMALRNQSIVLNLDVPKLTATKDVSVKLPVLMQSTEEPYIHSSKMIQE
jgi:hypothetical protein